MRIQDNQSNGQETQFSPSSLWHIPFPHKAKSMLQTRKENRGKKKKSGKEPYVSICCIQNLLIPKDKDCMRSFQDDWYKWRVYHTMKCPNTHQCLLLSVINIANQNTMAKFILCSRHQYLDISERLKIECNPKDKACTRRAQEYWHNKNCCCITLEHVYIYRILYKKHVITCVS